MKYDISHLYWRYATKKFDTDKKLSEEQLQVLKDALRLSPSSSGMQPWKFILVKDPAVREKIKATAWGQPQVTDASDLFVLCSRLDMSTDDAHELLDETAKAQNQSLEDLSGLKNMLYGTLEGKKSHPGIENWAARQVYIALGFLLSAAAQFHIDACPMEGFDPAQVDEILGLKEMGLTSRVLCPVGFRDESDPSAKREKVRFPEEKVFVTVEIPRK